MKSFLLLSILFINIYAQTVATGAEKLSTDLALLQDKSVAMVVNHSSTVGDVHLVDLLLKKGINVKTIFAPIL